MSRRLECLLDSDLQFLISRMNPYVPFLNSAGRLRSGWRLGLFVLAFAASMMIFGSLVRVLTVIGIRFHFTFGSSLENLIFRLVFLISALLAGWICNRWLEGLPWRALGLGLHQGWYKDLLLGSIIGSLSLALAALVAFAGGGLRFSFSETELLRSVIQSLATTLVLFVVAALAEEALFRGYPLQTLTRAALAWLAVVITSLPFALVHLQNPNVVAGFTFINTALAGVWLAASYLKTRSLWFPLGVHWAWNWALGSVFGLPVSGMKLSPYPLLQAVDHGPAWLTGGSYGIEGGIACTVALIISLLFIWRTRLLSPTPELLQLTSVENPVQH